MSRSGYIDDFDDDLALGRWRGVVASAIRGKRGQALLKDMLAALDAMPEKALVIGELQTTDGDVCALGALGKVRGIDMVKIDPEYPAQVAAAFDIAEPLAQEIVFMNDEYFADRWDQQLRKSVPMTDEERWVSMRAWVASKVAA
jgi:hypothetical protein